MAKTLDDIFNDDDFGLLNPKDKSSGAKTDEDRLIEAFEEINAFYEKNKREPSTSGMSEYSLLARLKDFRNDDQKKKILKPFDRFDLLGYVEIEPKTLEQIVEEDELGLLNPEGDISIFELKHVPKQDKRAETDFVAQRQAIPDDAFAKYETMFWQVHKELKEGKRKLLLFENIEKNLQVGNFYILDGVLLFLESADLQQEVRSLKSGDRKRVDGRTVTIFENGTKSNLLFRSLGKAIQKSGKLVTKVVIPFGKDFLVAQNFIEKKDIQSGWIYVLKSKSLNLSISGISDLYKIGFSKGKVEDRIRNAAKEATFLFADVEIVATYRCYNLNTHRFETLIHRFFGESCLNVDLLNEDKNRITPREWFVVPLQVINEAIELLIKGNITDYKYDKINKVICIR